MVDREMVIHGLELVKEDICERFTSGSQISIDCLRIDKALALLKEQEAVVHCRDCKHSERWYGDKRRCFLWHETGIDVFDDGFCNYGERQEGR